MIRKWRVRALIVEDIEEKIIDFIKKSPIGVTSSEIGRFLGINRVTLTKYLAIVKEKALIDFKQFGMAKLWYVPVKLNKLGFFKDMLLETGANLDEKSSREALGKSTLKLAKDTEAMYKDFYKVEKMNIDQVSDSIVDAEEKIGGQFTVVEKNPNVIILKVLKCPFGERVKKCPSLCQTTANICGVMAARNLGYAKVSLRKRIAVGDDHCDVRIYLKKSPESEKEQAKEFYPSEEIQ